MNLKHCILLIALCTTSSFAHSKLKVGDIRTVQAHLTKYTCTYEDGCFVDYTLKNGKSYVDFCDNCAVLDKKLRSRKESDGDKSISVRLNQNATLTMRYEDYMMDNETSWVVRHIKIK